MQKNKDYFKQTIAFMIQSLFDLVVSYSLIEKHAYEFFKAIGKFRHLILGKHTLVKVPLPAVKFMLSQTYLSGKLSHCLTKIQEHDLTTATSNTIRGRDLEFHLDQYASPMNDNTYDDDSDSNIFLIQSQHVELSENPCY